MPLSYPLLQLTRTSALLFSSIAIALPDVGNICLLVCMFVVIWRASVLLLGHAVFNFLSELLLCVLLGSVFFKFYFCCCLTSVPVSAFLLGSVCITVLKCCFFPAGSQLTWVDSRLLNWDKLAKMLNYRDDHDENRSWRWHSTSLYSQHIRMWFAFYLDLAYFSFFHFSPLCSGSIFQVECFFYCLDLCAIEKLLHGQRYLKLKTLTGDG